MGPTCCTVACQREPSKQQELPVVTLAETQQMPVEPVLSSENPAAQSVSAFLSHETKPKGNPKSPETLKVLCEEEEESKDVMLVTEVTKPPPLLRKEHFSSRNCLLPVADLGNNDGKGSDAGEERLKTEHDKPLSQPQKSLMIDVSEFRVERRASQLKSFESLGPLGEGTYGDVTRVRNRDTQEVRAVKRISKDRCQTTKSYVDEIQILKQLVPFALSIFT